MSTYDDTLLAARYAALAPEPLAGDWEDVLDRAGRARKRRRRYADSLQSGRRRRLVVFAAVALVIVLGAASALAVRAVLHRGIVGLAPVGATPSTPKRGELVLSFGFGHTVGDPGRFQVFLYADGRLISERLGDPSGEGDATGLLEQRLTPEGVELVRAEVISTGLVDHDLHLTSGEGLYSGHIKFRTGDRLVHVTWGNAIWGDVDPDVARQSPTPEQASALMRLDARLADPASWLPASAWEDPETRAYVPSGYSVCYEGGVAVGLDRVLALLPPAAENMLRAQEKTRMFPYWCSELTNEEARALERILDAAGVSGTKDVFGLTYDAPGPGGGATRRFSITFGPILPDQR
jgi:hypothetical protein